MLKYTALLASGVLSLGLAGASVAQDGPSRDDVVATVNGTQITLGQMVIARNQLPPQYQQLPDDVLFQGVLDQLIQQQVFADSVGAAPARVEIALANERRTLLAGEAIDALMQEALTDEAIQAAYEEIFSAAEPVTEWNAAHILVATEDEARAVLERVAAGEDFAVLAQELSTDFASGANGGALGWFGPGMMVAPFEAAVQGLEAGALSDPVETQFGWHIVKLNETREQQPPTLEQVRGEIVSQIQQATIEARLTELMDAAAIEMPAEGAFDPALLRDLDLLND